MNLELFPRPARGRRRAVAAAFALAGVAGWAQVVSVPPAVLTVVEGAITRSPPGDKEWTDVKARRALARGDRLWTDKGSHAEVQAGAHTLMLDGQTLLALQSLEERATQLSVTNGSLAATVPRLAAGENFEIDTPNLALRARQPGIYRVDVDHASGTTRVQVQSGAALVYGEQGQVVEMRAGQRITFRERSLARLQAPFAVAQDDFDRWVAIRNKQSVAAAPLPPTVHPDKLAAQRREQLAREAAEQKRMEAQAAAQRKAASAPVVAQGPVQAPLLPGMKPAPPAAPLVLPQPQVAAAKPAPVPAPAPAQPAPVAVVKPAPVPPPVVAQKPPAPAAPSAAALRAEEERRAAQARREQEAQRMVAARHAQKQQALLAKRRAAEEKRQAIARKAEEQRLAIAARRAREAERVAAAKKAKEDQRVAAAKRAQEAKRVADAQRREEEQRSAQARSEHLARLQEQARREEQARADRAAREQQQAREEEARREDEARREEQARRESQQRRRALAEQNRREPDQRTWPAPQPAVQPLRPAPQEIPVRRVS